MLRRELLKDFFFLFGSISLPREKTFQNFLPTSPISRAEQSSHSQVVLFIKTPVLHSSHQSHLKPGSPLATDINGIPPGDHVLPPPQQRLQSTHRFPSCSLGIWARRFRKFECVSQGVPPPREAQLLDVSPRSGPTQDGGGILSGRLLSDAKRSDPGGLKLPSFSASEYSHSIHLFTRQELPPRAWASTRGAVRTARPAPRTLPPSSSSSVCSRAPAAATARVPSRRLRPLPGPPAPLRVAAQVAAEGARERARRPRTCAGRTAPR